MAKLKENRLVRYVHKLDSDPNDETPNVSTAIVVKVHRAPGKPTTATLFVITACGTFFAQKVQHSHDPVERGTFHYPTEE